MRNPPTPREVRALRLAAVQIVRRLVPIYCEPGWVRIKMAGDYQKPCAWHAAEVRLIRNLILRDLRQLEYELKHGIGKKMKRR